MPLLRSSHRLKPWGTRAMDAKLIFEVAKEVFKLGKIVVGMAQDPSVPRATRAAILKEVEALGTYIHDLEAEEARRLNRLKNGD